MLAHRWRLSTTDLPHTIATMDKGFWMAILIVVAVVVYVSAKAVYYARKSEQQWQDVDKSKLKEWEDDDW